MDIAWVTEFADQGALMQLDGVMSGFEDIAAGTFPGPLSTNHWQGHYYGLPQNTNTQVLLWNREVFEAAGLTEAPTIMEAFRDYACHVSDPDNEQYGYALGGTYFWAPAPIFYAMGGQVVDEDITTASGYINGPESVAAFTMLTEMYNEGCISPNLLGGGVGTSDGLATGMYAMIIDGPWMVDIYQEQYPDFEVNFSLIPSYDGYTSSVVGGEDIVIFDGSPNAEAAMKWVAFLMSEESQLMMAEVGVMPTLSSLIGNEGLPDYFGVFLEQLQTAQARVPHPAWSDMDNAINNAFQRMLRGDQTPQEALDQAAEEINSLLE
jgi:multiple sugar transport system substrate-binding protein